MSFHVGVFCVDDGAAFRLGDSHDLNVKFNFGPSLYRLAPLLILDRADQFSGLYCRLDPKWAEAELGRVSQALEQLRTGLASPNHKLRKNRGWYADYRIAFREFLDEMPNSFMNLCDRLVFAIRN